MKKAAPHATASPSKGGGKGRWVTIGHGDAARHVYLSGPPPKAKGKGKAGRSAPPKKKPGRSADDVAGEIKARKAKEAAHKPAAKGPHKDLSGASPKEVRAHHEAMSAGWKKGLSDRESGAVQGYSSSLYQQVNDYHRSGKVAPGFKGSDLKGLTGSIDSALGKAKLGETTTVYRGVSDLRSLGIDPSKALGSVIHDKGYLSTSLTPKIAERFAGKQGAVLKITAPAGSRGASVAGMTNRRDEHEVLFARGAKVKVTKVERDARGRTVLHAELSHDDD